MFRLFLVIGLLGASLSAQISKEEKLLYTNLLGAAAIVGWGVSQWDYGKSDWHTHSEAWFERETANGGSDKLGHFYFGYLLTHVLASYYEQWGYHTDEAAAWGALSSFGLTGLVMEGGDGFSPYGSAQEDIIMDLAGAVVGYLWYRYPSLQQKIDFRVEFIPSVNKGLYDISTEYEKMKHLLAFKAEGFEALNHGWLKYLELHVGYFTRKFDHNMGNMADRERHLYVAAGINIPLLLRPYIGEYAAFFNYYQLPYSYLPAERIE